MVIAPGHYLERYLVDYDEVAFHNNQIFSEVYRLYTKDGADPLPYLSSKLIEFIIKHDDLYLEVSKGVMLTFRKNQALANADDIASLLSLAEIFHDACVTTDND
jgi:hypothetical protein